MIATSASLLKTSYREQGIRRLTEIHWRVVFSRNELYKKHGSFIKKSKKTTYSLFCKS